MKTRNILRYHVWWFTLIELVVVITILAILGTIGFIQLWGFAGSARDSVRISNLQALKKGLDLSQIQTGVYPLPESSVNITASWVVIGYQGFAKDVVAWLAKLSLWATKDPSDTTMYTTYSTNANQTKMQAMVFLEDGGSISAFLPSLERGIGGIFPTANASSTSDYSKRFPSTTGDSLGILLWNSGTTLNQPVQESGTGVDVVNTNSGYLAVFSKSDTITGTGNTLFTSIYHRNNELINNKSLANLDETLVGYWDMETLTGTLLKDLSGNRNDGTGIGGIIIWWVSGNGRTGKATSFDGTNHYIDINSLGWSIPADSTMSVWVKSIKRNLDPAGTIHIIGDINTQSPYSGRGIALHIGSNNITALEGGGGWVNSGNPLNDEWNFVTIVFHFANNHATIYNNGVKLNDDLFSWWGTMQSSLTRHYSIGGNTIGLYNFNGLIDEARVYNRALSDSEIRTLYNATK